MFHSPPSSPAFLFQSDKIFINLFPILYRTASISRKHYHSPTVARRNKIRSNAIPDRPCKLMTNPIDTSVSSVKMKAKRQSERGADAMAELNQAILSLSQPPDMSHLTGIHLMVLPPIHIFQPAISLYCIVYDLSIQ